MAMLLLSCGVYTHTQKRYARWQFLVSHPPLPCFSCVGAAFLRISSRHPWRLDYRVSCASGHVYCSCSGSAWLELRICSAGPWGAGYPVFGQAHPLFFGQVRLIRRFSTLATLADWTTEFRAHRATFTVHAPARRGASVAPCSAVPCRAGPTAASARDFNTEFSPATVLGQPRFCRLVGQSEFQFWSD